MSDPATSRTTSLAESCSPTFGSLFTGIGGFDLGLEKAGFQCRWQVEIDPFCLSILNKNWPKVHKHADIRTFLRDSIDPWRVDCVAGGFPCQDVSAAGRRAGITGERSCLWSEFARVIRVLRPRIALIENVPGLVDRGLAQVLADLAAIGFDAEWATVPASAIGAPHIRERLFVLAYPNGERWAQAQVLHRSLGESLRQANFSMWQGAELRELDGVYGQRVRALPPPGVQRVADGLPGAVDRFRVIGNSIVPQVAELIGSIIVRR